MLPRGAGAHLSGWPERRLLAPRHRGQPAKLPEDLRAGSLPSGGSDSVGMLAFPQRHSRTGRQPSEGVTVQRQITARRRGAHRRKHLQEPPGGPSLRGSVGCSINRDTKRLRCGPVRTHHTQVAGSIPVRAGCGAPSSPHVLPDTVSLCSCLHLHIGMLSAAMFPSREQAWRRACAWRPMRGNHRLVGAKPGPTPPVPEPPPSTCRGPRSPQSARGLFCAPAAFRGQAVPGWRSALGHREQREPQTGKRPLAGQGRPDVGPVGPSALGRDTALEFQAGRPNSGWNSQCCTR